MEPWGQPWADLNHAADRYTTASVAVRKRSLPDFEHFVLRGPLNQRKRRQPMTPEQIEAVFDAVMADQQRARRRVKNGA